MMPHSMKRVILVQHCQSQHHVNEARRRRRGSSAASWGRSQCCGRNSGNGPHIFQHETHPKLEETPEAHLPVLVTHGGTLSNLVVAWLGLPLDVLPERTCFSAIPGSISVLKRNRYGNPMIDRLNDRARPEGLS
jgi:broad specificity phosphatase PhoE